MKVWTTLPDGLYELLEEYKAEKRIPSDSEAVRDIVRRFLTEVWKPSSSSRPSSEVREEEKLEEVRRDVGGSR
ncbi:hypothetical protein [Archaeoglobus sp.]